MNTTLRTLSIFLATLPSIALGQAGGTYNLIAPIGTLTGSLNLQQYLNGVFETTVGIGGILAVLMLVICGIKLMGTGSVAAKSEAKQCIWNAIFGLLLAIGSWILLNTINPLLLNNDAKLPHTDSGASPTLAVDGLTAKQIRISTGVNVPTGFMKSGTPYALTYFATAGEFIVNKEAATQHKALLEAINGGKGIGGLHYDKGGEVQSARGGIAGAAIGGSLFGRGGAALGGFIGSAPGMAAFLTGPMGIALTATVKGLDSFKESMLDLTKKAMDPKSFLGGLLSPEIGSAHV